MASSRIADAAGGGATGSPAKGSGIDGVHHPGGEQPDTVAVQAVAGRLRGTLVAQPAGGPAVRAFKGVPYAAPPIGRLRWKPPQPLPPWEGERDAGAFGPDCWQEDREPSRAPHMSEDCLYLNIWAPARAAPGSLPVMVWLHGGSYVYGSGAHVVCDGVVLAQEGVVLVTVNYRLGLFGFLAHPGLSAESDLGVSGNYGLLDQIRALQWVSENIAVFGGDPGRVTLFGVSAGAASISLLLSASQGEGLFQQAILQSPGAARPLASLAEAERAGLALGMDIEALRRLPADALLAMTPRLMPAQRGLTTPRVLRPIRDGWLLREDERRLLKQRRLRPMPLIVGGNADEGSVLTQDWPVRTLAQYDELLAQTFGDQAARFRELYPAQADGDVRRRVAELFADTQFNYGVRLLAQSMSQCESRTWRYLFTRRRPDETDGPHHTAEVPYVFGNLRDCSKAAEPVFDGLDEVVCAGMRRAWVAFATTGDPATASTPWPGCTASGEPYLEFGSRMSVGTGWRRSQLDALEEFFTRERGI